MKKIKFTIIAVFLLATAGMAQNQSWEEAEASKEGKLNVFYFENSPFAFRDSKNQESGLEIDIIKYFAEWLWEKKKVKISLDFIPYKNFNQFYSEFKAQKTNAIGAGTVTTSEERSAEIDFSSPYLKNISVLISDGKVPTAKTMEELNSTFSGMRPVTIKGSIHENQVIKIIKASGTEVSPVYVDSPEEIPGKIQESAKYYGYIDLISFWSYVKQNSHYVKMHKVANIENEEFGFIFPQGSDWRQIFDEFMESGFGFTATKDYHRILEKYLGFEVIEKVELD